jgi:hypothetical protein
MAVIICARYDGSAGARPRSRIHGSAPLGARSLNACCFTQPESRHASIARSSMGRPHGPAGDQDLLLLFIQ